MKPLTHASLFSGIGGFDLAAEWAGWTNLFNCEKDAFCQRVLKYHFPDAIQYSDIRETDFTIWRGRVDVLTGGFPCQPFSTAGKRKGTNDDRYLWPEMLRAIREIRPRWVVGENVRGIVNWNAGLVFDTVCADLEAEGYEVTPYVLPACGVGAPHRRDRVWFVAKDTQRVRCNGGKSKKESGAGGFGQSGAGDNVRVYGTKEATANPASLKDHRRRSGGFQPEFAGVIPDWERFTTQSPVCLRDDGISYWVDNEALLAGRTPRQPYIAIGKLRQESIKAYGNAIVPQVAYQIFKAINECEQ